MKKKIYLILSIVCVCILTTLFAINIVNNNNSKSKESNLIVNVQDNEQIKLTKKLLSGTSTQSSDTIIVTATVGPSVALNKNINWSLEWIDENYGKEFDGFITMEVSEDTSYVTLTYIKPFDCQLLLKATSVSNSNISATCTIDCYKRITDYTIPSVLLGNAVDEAAEYATITKSNLTINFLENMNNCSFEDFSFTITKPTLTLKGTIDVSILESYSISLSNEVKTVLSNNNISYSAYYTINNISQSIVLSDLLLYLIPSLSNVSSEQYANVISIISNIDCWFTFTSTYVLSSDGGSGPNYTYSYDLIGFNTDYYKNVLTISLDKTSIIY